MLGIVADWANDATTFVCSQLVRQLGSMGVRTSCRQLRSRTLPFSVRDLELPFTRLAFKEWLKRCRVIIWGCMPPEVVLHTSIEANVANILLADWSQIRAADFTGPLTWFHQTVAPTRPVKRWAEYAGHSWDWFGDWQPGIPRVRRQPRSEKTWAILVPLTGDQLPQISLEFLEWLPSLLRACPDVLLRLDLDTGDTNGAARQRLRKLRKRFPTRVSCYEHSTPAHRGALYASSDLVLWPAVCETYGIPGCLATTYDLPVIAYNHPVIDDVTSDGRAVLIETAVDEDVNRVPFCRPDHQALFSATEALLREPGQLRDFCYHPLSKADIDPNAWLYNWYRAVSAYL